MTFRNKFQKVSNVFESIFFYEPMTNVLWFQLNFDFSISLSPVCSVSLFALGESSLLYQSGIITSNCPVLPKFYRQCISSVNTLMGIFYKYYEGPWLWLSSDLLLFTGFPALTLIDLQQSNSSCRESDTLFWHWAPAYKYIQTHIGTHVNL